MTDTTTFMKMLFHSYSLRSMTTIREGKEEADEGLNAYYIPGTVLVTLGNVWFCFFFPFSPHNNSGVFFLFLSLFYQRGN